MCSSMDFDKYIEMCIYHHSHDTEQFTHPASSLLFPFIVNTLPFSPIFVNHGPIRHPYSFVFFKMSYSRQPFGSGLFHLAKMHLRFLHIIT